jgi:hypothetical protein
MRNPDRVKKTSTPRKPPGSHVASAWKIRTATTAIARIPSRPGMWVHRGVRDDVDAGASMAVVVICRPGLGGYQGTTCVRVLRIPRRASERLRR